MSLRNFNTLRPSERLKYIRQAESVRTTGVHLLRVTLSCGHTTYMKFRPETKVGTRTRCPECK